MVIGHLLVSEGVSGDLLLSTLLDAGAPLDAVTTAVDALGLDDIMITVTSEVAGDGHGVAATRAVVHTSDTPRLPTWRSIETTLEASALPTTIRANARRVLLALFEAEAHVHAVALDEVDLHELGSLDTIVDVVAVCAAIEALGLERLTHGPINLGGGTVTTAHGRLPVPPPAVAALLGGRVVYGDGDRELTTPTGAALLTTLAKTAPGIPPMALTATGRGTVLPSGSVVTLLIGHDQPEPIADLHDEPGSQPLVVIEATVDDLEPQVVPVILDRLRDAGAFDAFASPAQMKKGRTGLTITVLADPSDLADLRHLLLAETSTIGVRWYRAERVALERDEVTVSVDGQTIRIKRAWLDGDIINQHPEFDDVKRAAEALGRPVRDVLRDAQHPRSTDDGRSED